jgi:hypothetical protein
MNTTEDIEARIKTFKASSVFTPGDPYCFSVEFSEEARLPGKFDPTDYMKRLYADIGGKNVLVVCPGNSGLCVAAIRAGASTVVGFEPRVIYQKATEAVAFLTAEVIGSTFIHRTGDDKMVEKFDVVFWPEGVDDIPHPKATFDTVLSSLASGGLLCLELTHGTHGVLPESTNCWKPTQEALEETIPGLGEFEIIGKLAGRNRTRMIYTIRNNAEPKVEGEGDLEPTVEKLQQLDDRADSALDDFTTASTAEDKSKALHAALDAVTEKVETLKEAGLFPEPAPVEDEVGELDSIYEGRASTPKSKAKKAESTSGEER